MFAEKQYECVTVPEVVQEIKRTQKFKEKYPWRIDYLSMIKAKNLKNQQFDTILKIIHNTLEVGKQNKKTKKYFNLSRVDKIIAAYAVSNQLDFSSADADLAIYLEQEFDIKNYYPLAILNIWLQKRLFKWDNARQQILFDWDRCNEHPQPKEEVIKFKNLSGFDYPGLFQK